MTGAVNSQNIKILNEFQTQRSQKLNILFSRGHATGAVYLEFLEIRVFSRVYSLFSRPTKSQNVFSAR